MGVREDQWMYYLSEYEWLMGQVGLSAGVIDWWALLYNFSCGEDRPWQEASKALKKITRMWAEGLKRHGLKLVYKLQLTCRRCIGYYYGSFKWLWGHVVKIVKGDWSTKSSCQNHHICQALGCFFWGWRREPAGLCFRGPTKARGSAMAEVVIHPFGVLHVACRFKKTTVIGQINLAMTL